MPTPEIGPHRRIHRDQPDLERIVQIDIVTNGAVEHRLAVFVFADLQIGRVGGAFDEVAGRIDHEQAHLAALDLTAEQKRHVETEIGRFKILAVGFVHHPHGASDALRRLEHGRRVEERLDLARLWIFDAFVERRNHRLADREIASGGDRDHALARLAKHMQLAKSGDVVEAGVGARVGDHNKAVTHQNAAAISHRPASQAVPVVCYDAAGIQSISAGRGFSAESS